MAQKPNYAVIDVGTNTLTLLIAQPGVRKPKVVHDEAIITRLGKGLAESHFFDAEAMGRTREALSSFSQTCKKYKVKKIIAVGTASCRIAANTEVFLTAVEDETKIKIDVISGEKEAEYTFGSAWREFGGRKKKIIVIDIGGGSTEVMTGPLSDKKQEPDSLISLPIGSVRFTEQFVRSDPISQENFEALHRAIKNGIADELDFFFPEDTDFSDHEVVATAGTATTLSTINQKLKIYDSKKVHGASLSIKHLEKIITELISKDVKERQKITGMEPLRADVLLAGALILLELMRFFDKKEALISDRGLRYGVFYKKWMK